MQSMSADRISRRYDNYDLYNDSRSRLAEMRLPNGTKRDYFYDFAGRVERQTDTHTPSGTILLDQQYRFDALSRIIEESVTPEPGAYSLTSAIMTFDSRRQRIVLRSLLVVLDCPQAKENF